jgi:hypothetical protein
MTVSAAAVLRLTAFSGALLCALAIAAGASAQFSPPSTVFGSISDSNGPVDAGVPVEAYIGTTLCGTKGKTEFTGDGAAKVTVYVVDVVSDDQISGCGKTNPQQKVRIKIGDRFADQTATWAPGPVQLDVTFGNATPVPIPTFTPAPTSTPDPNVTPRPAGTAAPGQVATIPAGSPGAGSPVPTLKGGITSATPGQTSSPGADSDGGLPVWATAVLVLAGIAVLGGGAGFVMARNNRAARDEPPADEDEF